MSDPFADLPKNHFGAILADPPWRFETWSGDRLPERVARACGAATYKIMEPEEIGRLDVVSLASNDCCLFMWTTWPILPQAMRVIEDWGFIYKTCGFSWLKADPYRLWGLDEDVYMGLGYWTRANSEPCLLATRGKPKRLNADVRQGIIAPRREHSRKPDGIHERIERLVAGPYLELFARQSRPGWTTWGNEKTKFDKVTA